MKKKFLVRGVPIELQGKLGSAKLWDFEFSCNTVELYLLTLKSHT